MHTSSIPDLSIAGYGTVRVQEKRQLPTLATLANLLVTYMYNLVSGKVRTMLLQAGVSKQ